MRKFISAVIIVFMMSSSYAQNLVNLPFEKPENVEWSGGMKNYFSDIWDTQVNTNVSTPTLEIYKPAPENNTGTAVIIAPGGGLYALSITSEGTEVAQWLKKKGITALVLRYRLVPTAEDGVAEISELSQKNPAKIGEEVGKVIPYSISDGLRAIEYARSNAEDLGIDPKKIGFMGFSAGGAVTMGVAYSYIKSNRPDFLVPVYPWTDAMPVQKPKPDSPPMLIICASDDELGLATGSIDLYNSWYNEKFSVGLHMYSKGGHGFGMRQKDLPSDKWIERFYDWSVSQGITVPVN
ncbi:alpha/beta hydrolase [Lutimonas zeaxanthinifaciens]|uniref:alpha/beta hydrolase n=1 Tax=Lutimonas zeaxanthinifaciens TaxID=3060215 RepID=UPI00265D43AA|nr:alpha/beta hydrolase [Lutimonas sp. YSD2104]WKK65537.1 alpha/beta hydrolase [Lutimonas sp. YSD2104]